MSGPDTRPLFPDVASALPQVEDGEYFLVLAFGAGAPVKYRRVNGLTADRIGVQLPPLYVALAKGGTSEAFDVRLVGPGGWYTTTANATYSEAHFQGRQLSRVSGLPYIDVTDDAGRRLQ